MIDLKFLSNTDVYLLTIGKINFHLGTRNPYGMHKIHKNQNTKKIKKIPAIYFLFHKRKLVYIGKCTSLRKRIRDHIRGRENLNIPPKEFDTIAQMYLSLEAAEYVEPFYIAHYRPLLNKIGVDKTSDQLDIFQ